MAESPRLQECLVMGSLLPLLLLSTISSGHTIHYIKPTPSTSCPADPCSTLSEYAQQLPHNLTSSTKLLLLPGDHVLSVNFTVENVSDFEISSSAPTSSHATRIMCQGLVGFAFRNNSHVTMHGLTVDSCGKGAVIQLNGYNYTTAYGMSIHSVLYSSIANCSFQDSIVTALGVFYSRLYLRGNNHFTNNCRRCFERNYACFCFGGGIYTKMSTLTITGNNTFRVNSATVGGGIAAVYSVLNFTGIITFEHNSAVYGGGIAAENNTVLNFTGIITFEHNSAKFGGGIRVWRSTLSISGIVTFGNNSAAEFGGGIAAENNTVLNFTGIITFEHNSAKFGGGIRVWRSTLSISGIITFGNNSAAEFGGGIFTWDNSTLNFSGISTFGNNSAEHYGGGIYAQSTVMNFNSNNSLFANNNATVTGGGIFIFQCDTLSFTGNISFTHNSAVAGGGMSVLYSKMKFTGNCIFTSNSANSVGGGIYVYYSTLSLIANSTFRENSAGIGGGICAAESTLRNTENNSDNIEKNSGGGYVCTSIFIRNSALIHGGAVYTENSALSFQGHNIFSGNSAQYYAGGVYSKNSTLMFNGSTSFNSNSGHLLGGGIYGLGTLLYFTGNCSFTANTAARGGGEYLVNSFNFLSQHVSVTMDSNSALEYGGAVYVEDSDPISYCSPENINLENCPFQVNGLLQVPNDEINQLFSIYIDPKVFHKFLQSNRSIAHEIRSLLNISVHFCNNHARKAGSAVYGGSVDSCISHLRYYAFTGYIQGVFGFNWHVPNLELEPNSISSDPFQVCLCKDEGINCSTDKQMQVYPGQQLNFSVVTTGQRDGIVPGVVRASLNAPHGNVSLAPLQDTQNVDNTCTELYYQVHSSVANNSGTLVLYADGPCSTNGKLLVISLDFLDCPHGFSLNPSEGICECEHRLQKYTTSCNVTERTLERSGVFWVGYDHNSEGLILHPHCPFDYCVSAHINVTLNDTDKQCENNRSGLLCGDCKSGFSLALGTSKCLQCSNIYIWLLIPFALAGIALVLLLLIFKLTVAAGTINGLIFYANIVAVNHSVFFSPNETNILKVILKVFIAWLNLDLGIETCFFDGMNAYVKTWLQFVFPLYVWSLVGLIIIGSEYSSRIASFFGSNPVAVLATLFLLSYAKLLRTIIAALSFAFLDYPHEVRVAVWQYDGNIRYIYGKHIALFLVALLTFLLLFLPYTFLLTVGQWLQAKSNQRFFCWINKPRIKPFFDAYQAPYRDQHRYWTGLMLCFRFVLFTVFVLLSLQSTDPIHNLPAIVAVVIGLFTITRFTGMIYKKFCLDVLEASFILNLGILAAATYTVRSAEKPESQAAVTYISVGIAFATFVGVLVYHMYQRVWPKLQQRIHLLHHRREHQSDDEEADTDSEAQTSTAPTMTIVECPSPSAQPLIASTTFTELREPLNLIDTSDH